MYIMLGKKEEKTKHELNRTGLFRTDLRGPFGTWTRLATFIQRSFIGW